MYQRIKQRVHQILDGGPGGGLLCEFVDVFLISLIVLNVIAVILETVESIYSSYIAYFTIFERISVTIFTIEYFLRLWSCTTESKTASPILGRIRYATSPMAIIDIVAIAPFYLPYILPDFRFIRLFRFFRLFRLLKLGRYSKALQNMAGVLQRKKEDLIIAFSSVLILLVLSASLIYLAEHPAQPEEFSSIPASMWWAVVTLTTVGYGDVYPVTVLGKFIGAFIAILGIGMFALPAGILASGFAEQLKQDDSKELCPHCGGELDRQA